MKSVDNQILRRELADGDDETLMILAMDILAKNDIHVAKGKRDKEVMTVLYAQNKYMSHVMASGRAVQALDEIAPEYINKFRLETTNAGSVMNSISIDRDFNKYKKDNLYNLAKNEIEINSTKYNADDYTFNPPFGYPYIFWRIEPDLVAQIGGPDGFFFGNARLAWSC